METFYKSYIIIDMEISRERIQELKDLMEEKSGKEISWEEATEASHNLVGLVKILYDFAIEEHGWKQKLKVSPSGFILEGIGRTCSICGNSSGVDGCWYDKFGIRCFICQEAVKRKEIPPSLSKSRDSWYSKYDLDSRFNLKGPTLRSWIKKGIIKARTVTYNGSGVHTYVFLIKDNKDFLPPKKMTESRLVKETIDGKDWVHSEPWYRFVKAHEYLKGYKIMDHLVATPKNKNERRHRTEYL